MIRPLEYHHQCRHDPGGRRARARERVYEAAAGKGEGGAGVGRSDVDEFDRPSLMTPPSHVVSM